ALLTWPERYGVVVADPGNRRQRAVEAGEPGIPLVVRRAGLAGEIAAPELARTLTGAAGNHVVHHVLDEPGVLRRDHARRQVHVLEELWRLRGVGTVGFADPGHAVE